MSDPSLGRKLADALPDEKRAWSDERVERVARSMARRRARRMALRGVAMCVGVLVLGGVTASWVRRPPTVTLADGSAIRPLDRSSVVRMTTELPTRTVVELVSGAALFDVAHVEGRLFRVEAGGVAVEVLGTRFVVERTRKWVKVAVERGRVQVLSGGPVRVLGTGETLEVPVGSEAAAVDLAPTAPPVVPVGEPVVPPDPPAQVDPPSRTAKTSRRVVPTVSESPAWRAPAERGDFDRAYRELRLSGPKSVRDVPNELLLAADVTRLSHHPLEAVPLLERVVRDHAKDARAPLAAFTLGRALLDELGRPQQAADAFARARSLAPSGPLAADALGREVEAWSRAGDTGRARARAEEYLRLYPKGARSASVRRFGDLE